ncbi:hypothetical protein L2Y94_00685 [Luteibacter aegosomatis]|uniref:hypothetical protein n=1 Tax=Luteibacter aegosomatis TaxID=2911537 RepID=UPI001FF9BD59|nr:hypothetical protein [Luteibacter aegosomatis]UPG85915.1 hypothetical protein L2Y94_00685 [Luteibacter aegosomatis]
MRRLAIAILGGALAACVPLKKDMPSPGDMDPLRREIVNDVTGLLVVEFDPTVIALQPVSSQGALRSALHASLRDRGYRMGSTYPDAQAFDCEVIPLWDNQYLVRVVVGRHRLSRLWIANGTHAYGGGAWTRGQ